MNITHREISVKEVYDAIAMDGYDHLRQDWVTFKKVGKTLHPKGGCLVGMAAINLRVVPELDWLDTVAAGPLAEAMSLQKEEYDPETGDWIVPTEVDILGLYGALNSLSVPRGFRPTGYSETDYLPSQVGDALVHLNDEEVNGEYRYSYEDLAGFAKKILEPHFDTTLVVTELDYTDAESINW